MEREQQYVGIDLHRRRSVIVRMNDAGEVLAVTKIDNDPLALSLAIAEAGPDPEVALEACYGWYWAADLLQAEGARVHLVHPLWVCIGGHWLHTASLVFGREVLDLLVVFGLIWDEVAIRRRASAWLVVSKLTSQVLSCPRRAAIW